MSFSEGFASGAQVGDRIKQRILEKKMRELEQTRYDATQKLQADERTYQRSRDTVADNRHAAEMADRARRADWNESLDEYNAGYRRDRDAVGDQRYAGEQSRRAQGDIMGQLDKALTQNLRRRKIEAEIKAMQLGKGGPMAGGYQQTTSYDEDGNPIVTRIPMPQQAPGAPGGRMGQMPAGIQQQYQQQGGAPAPAMAPQDQQALAWAKANAGDPRAAAILQRLGAR